MYKIKIDREKCKGCGVCIESCPNNLLILSKEFNKLGFTFIEQVDPEHCTGCGLCALVCPEAAIEIYKEDQLKVKRPKVFYDIPTSYCPGCSHGVIHRLIAELIEEKNLQEKAIGVTSIGCAIFIYRFLNIDYVEGAHGRAPAVATGIKRVNPDSFVFTYQGDGDIAAIGISEVIHAANRGENFTVIFVNNGNFGMTGGQMSPTTLLGKKTTTSPFGKKASDGYPIKLCEMLANLEGSAYIARGAVNSPKNIIKTKKYIKKAFEVQTQKKGFSIVEVLGICPTNWKMSRENANEVIKNEMTKIFPLGEIKVPKEES